MNKKENYWRTINRQYPEWVPVMSEAVKTIYPCIVERPWEAGKDCFGVEWDYNEAAEGGTYPLERNRVITNIEDWRNQLILPDIDQLDWSGVKKVAESIDRDKYWVQGFCEMGIFERSYLLLGMEEALIDYLLYPEEMYALCDAIADYKVKLISKFHEAAQLDMMWYGDDWGTQLDLFLPPQVWRQIIKPTTQKIYNCLKERNIFINQHSCGKIESIFGDLCEMGAQMWNPCQPCNDLKKLKQVYGKSISFCGGIDSQFILDNDLKTPEHVKEEVKQRIDEMASIEGGYVAEPSHGVPYDEEKLKAMQETIEDYGRQKYAKEQA